MSDDSSMSVNVVMDASHPPSHTETVTITQANTGAVTITQGIPSVTITNVSVKLEELNADIAQLYKALSDKIAVSVATNHFSFETLDTILAKTVEVIEEYSKTSGGLTGIEKRNIGLSLVKLVLNDLHFRSVINDEVYNAMNLALTYMAPALFYAAKVAWTKLQEIDSDIEKNGRSGCFRRNC